MNKMIKFYQSKTSRNCLQTSLFQSLGNHEFDEGVSGVIAFVENVECPVLAANLDLRKVPELSNKNNLNNYVVFNVSGYSIGVIGYITPDTKIVAVTNDVEYTDEIVTIREEAAKLRNEGVQIIIALGHSGYIKDQEIAQEIEEVDLVVGGHSHTFLYTGTKPDSEDAKGPYPTYIKQTSGKVVPVVQAYAYTKYLGSIYLAINSKGQIINVHGKPILLDKSIPQDPDVLAITKRYSDKVTVLLNEEVGKTAVVLDGQSCETQECNLGNLITDAMVYQYTLLYKGEHWTDAPIAIIQAGGIRASIAHEKMPATITKGEIMTVQPFPDNLLKVEIPGKVLLQVLEMSISKYGELRRRGFLQFSGLKVVYNITKPAGNRVVKAIARCWFCEIPKYTNVESRQIYNVIVSNFLQQGGDGYTMLKNLVAHVLPYNPAECLENYIRRHSPLIPELEGRIIIIN